MCFGLRVTGLRKAWLLIDDWSFPTSDYQAIRQSCFIMIFIATCFGRGHSFQSQPGTPFNIYHVSGLRSSVSGFHPAIIHPPEI